MYRSTNGGTYAHVHARGVFDDDDRVVAGVLDAHDRSTRRRVRVAPRRAGKELVQTTCAKCHGLNLIGSSWGYTKEGWHQLIGTMVALPKDQADTATTYLATHFPEKPAPEAVVIKGPVEVTIKEWLVPTLGSRPRDPLLRARWIVLVGRHVRTPARAARFQDG